MTRKRRNYQPKYPYTLLAEAVDVYKTEVVVDDEVRNMFLTHIQPLVRYCVGRHLRIYGEAAIRYVKDVVGFVNVKLLESWLPTYLASKGKSQRIPGAVKFLSESVRGYVRKFMEKNYDPRLVSLGAYNERSLTLEHRADREAIEAACERMIAEHVALRPRPDLDMEVVRKLMWHLAWEDYRSIDGVSG